MAVVVATTPYIAEDAASLISADIEDLPPVLNWEQAGDRSVLIHDGAGNQDNQHRGRARRRGCRLQGCPLCAARAFHSSPAYRRSLGGARAGRGVGRRRDAHDRIRHHQGTLLQPQHARLHARSSRSFRRDESGGRRGRIWCSRGILSGRFPDPGSRAAARPAGEMDRGPPRALSCDQSLARSHLRSGDRVRPGGNHHRAARRGDDRYRGRVCPRHRWHVANSLRAVLAGSIPDFKLCVQGERVCIEQDTVGNLSRPRTRRCELLPRAVDRHRRRRS